MNESCSKCFLFFVFFKLGSSRSVHLVRPQQPVHVNIVRLHQRRWTVVLVAPPHQLRSPVHVVRPHHIFGSVCGISFCMVTDATPFVGCHILIYPPALLMEWPVYLFFHFVVPAASVYSEARSMILVWHWRSRLRPFRHNRWIRNIR